MTLAVVWQQQEKLGLCKCLAPHDNFPDSQLLYLCKYIMNPDKRVYLPPQPCVVDHAHALKRQHYLASGNL